MGTLDRRLPKVMRRHCAARQNIKYEANLILLRSDSPADLQLVAGTSLIGLPFVS
jgi:hypothetical protein